MNQFIMNKSDINIDNFVKAETFYISNHEYFSTRR